MSDTEKLLLRIQRVEQRLKLLYVVGFVTILACVGVVAWAVRGAVGRDEVRDRFECRREVALMGYGSSHSEFKGLWRDCMAARRYTNVEEMRP
jgi:hypothetical protein